MAKRNTEVFFVFFLKLVALRATQIIKDYSTGGKKLLEFLLLKRLCYFFKVFTVVRRGD